MIFNILDFYGRHHVKTKNCLCSENWFWVFVEYFSQFYDHCSEEKQILLPLTLNSRSMFLESVVTHCFRPKSCFDCWVCIQEKGISSFEIEKIKDTRKRNASRLTFKLKPILLFRKIKFQMAKGSPCTGTCEKRKLQHQYNISQAVWFILNTCFGLTEIKKLRLIF